MSGKEQVRVYYIPYETVAQAMLLRWAWFELKPSFDSTRKILVSPREVGTPKVVDRAPTQVIRAYTFMAVDQDGNEYRVTMEQSERVEPIGFSRRRLTNDAGRKAISLAVITPASARS